MKAVKPLHKPDRTIQLIIVFLFFISIFANIGIMLHSHVTERFNDQELDNIFIKSLQMTINRTDSRLNFARFVASCIQDVTNQPGLASSSLLSFFKSLPLESLDDSVFSSMNDTLKQEIKKQEQVLKFLNKPIVNPHNYRYIHNPAGTCLKRKIEVIFAVHSAPENFENRLKSRQGLKGSYSFEKGNNATLLFFLGKSSHRNKSSKFQVQINMEMRRFGDIVQEDFFDEYRNLTLKSTAVLKWVSTHCPGAKFVVKTDDNVGVKANLTVQALVRHRKRFGNFILGRWNTKNSVQRTKGAKNYMSFEEFPNATYPPHLLGGALGFPVSTAKLLYQATLRVPPIWLDDVYITGICAPLVNVPAMMDLAFDFKINFW